ncbi:MAG: GIY-YIG nuclease family protein [Flavobacteriales bacterium]|nr:GIY-YIG nuclease family protein [Flavobacteriales bacterium]
MKGYTYILECSDDNYYVGSTVDIDRRLSEHTNGRGANFTKRYPPVKLVYLEIFIRIDDAFYREKQIQGWTRAKKLALIAENMERLKMLAECLNSTNSKYFLRPNAAP